MRGHCCVGDPEQQIELARKIMRQGLSVRETETLVARAPERVPAEDSLRAPESERSARQTCSSAPWRKILSGRWDQGAAPLAQEGGRIEIEYYSNEELGGPRSSP